MLQPWSYKGSCPDLPGSLELQHDSSGGLEGNRTALEAGAATGQLRPGEKDVLTCWEARLPEAGVEWRMFSPQGIAILLLAPLLLSSALFL